MKSLHFACIITLLVAGAFAQQQSGAQTATLVFYREGHFRGSALKPSVYVDDKEVARLKNGSYCTVRVDPGKHTLTSSGKHELPVVVDLKPGETSYVEMTIQPKGFHGVGRLISVPADIGKYAASRLKNLDTM